MNSASRQSGDPVHPVWSRSALRRPTTALSRTRPTHTGRPARTGPTRPAPLRSLGEIRRTPHASVIVAVAAPHYELLQDQLGQLSRQRTAIDFEVIVADNDGRLLPSECPSARVIPATTIPGASHARDVGAAAARGRCLLFCDADDLVGPTWVEDMVRTVDRDGFVAGSFRVVPFDSPLVDDILAGNWPESGFEGRARFHERVPIASSGNMGIRRDLFEAAGGFDQRYLRSQDVALTLALRASGVLPHFAPSIGVVIRENASPVHSPAWLSRHAGAARVDLARQFRVGPGPLLLCLRALARFGKRLGEFAVTRSAQARRRVRDQFWQLVGIFGETAVGSARFRRTPTARHE